MFSVATAGGGGGFVRRNAERAGHGALDRGAGGGGIEADGAAEKECGVEIARAPARSR
jgi:hypothetical protein